MTIIYLIFLILSSTLESSKESSINCYANDSFIVNYKIINSFKKEIDQFWYKRYTLPSADKTTKDLLIKYDNIIFTFHSKDQNIYLGYMPLVERKGDCYLFYGDQIPQMLIDYFKDVGFLSIYREKKVVPTPLYFIKKKMSYSFLVDSKYFITKKGITLGDSSSDIINKLGPPESMKLIQNDPEIIRYKWINYGKSEVEERKELKQKTLPQDKICIDIEYGQTIIIDFIKKDGVETAQFIFIGDH